MNEFKERLEKLTADLIEVFEIDEEFARQIAGTLGMSYIEDVEEEDEDETEFIFNEEERIRY